MMGLTHPSPHNANALTKIPEDTAEHNDSCYNEYCGMSNWLLHPSC
jgi:hypothetical protein